MSAKRVVSLSTAFLAGGVAAVAMTGTAVAAAHYLALGTTNSASATTTLKSTHGTTLSLKAPGTKPALKVSNTVQIPNLNASLLGGKASSAFATPTMVAAARAHFRTVVVSMNKGAGVAHCPSGWHPTGGGVLPTTAQGATPPTIAVSSASSTNNSEDGWVGAATGDAQYPGTGFVWVDCTDGPYTSALAAANAGLRPAMVARQLPDSSALVASVRAAYTRQHASQ